MPSLLSPEARVLLLSIGERPDSGAIAAAIHEPAFDWNRLMWLADREKAIPALRHALTAMPDGDVPAERLAHLSRISSVSEFRMLRLEQLLADALDTLAREHIDVVLLKGAALATTVYGSFKARPMYDVDLLVQADDAQRAWDTLRSSGWLYNAEECPADFYESHYHLPPLDDPMRTGLSLELHRAPTDGAIMLTSSMIWNDARPVSIHGRPALIPSPEHQALHLAIHFAWTHGMASAAWRTFSDLNHLVTRGAIDWNAFLHAVETSRAVTSCYWALRLARALTSTPIPDEVLLRLRPPRPEWLLTLIERHYAGALFQFSPAACPSVRMTRMVWSAGMAPRWSGVGHVRPWHRGETWVMAGEQRRKRSLGLRLKGLPERGREWSRYLSALRSAPS